MARTIHKTENPVTLEGFQAILAPSKFGYSLSAVVDTDVVDKLDTERSEVLKWAEGKLKNPKRSTLKPEPWEEVSKDKYKIKFSWNEENRPPVVDTEGTQLTDTNIPLYAGSTVKLGFYQKPYILRDGVTYGSSLKLVGVQVVSVKGEAGVDTGDMDVSAVAELFGKSTGYKAADPNITPDTTPSSVEDDEEDF
jgi:hypothetical protein|tara:strand:+ start:177 stop:758 length:582 start_codon:yes stop_codon:yes gene_type:complete